MREAVSQGWCQVEALGGFVALAVKESATVNSMGF